MTAPQAPYPAETRAKGWRFELDLERIRQSDTWALATTEARPWLLMLWATAWEQTPCGSLPNDDELIAARIGMSPKQFQKQRNVLLRGWHLHDDGRLYHSTIAQRVVEMLERRRSEADRKAAARARKLMEGGGSPEEVPPVSHGTNAGLHPESDTGTGTSKPSLPTVEKEARKRAPALARPPEVAEQVWDDWLALRKAKRAPVTETTVDGARAEAGKAGMTLEAFLRVWCARGSQGLQAEWLKPSERNPQSPAPAPEPAWRAEQRERMAKALGPYATRRPAPADTIDMEDAHAPRILG